MRKPEFPRFSEHDTTLSFWLEDTKDKRMVEVRNAWVRSLRARGFRVQLDQETAKHYPCLKKDHHGGRKGDLEFRMRLCGRSLELVFFQNVVRENRNGGQYDFDKLQKMPYLIRKQYEAEKLDLVALMGRLGYTFEPEIRLRGMALIEKRRAELTDFQGPDLYTRPWPSYNIKSAAGREMTDGDELYGLRRGRLYRGFGFRDLNSSWFFLMPCGTVWVLKAYELCHREDLPRPLRGRFIDARTAEKRMSQAKETAVKAEAYERAAAIRDALRARFPAQKAA
jgi:hypothetical protein